MSQHGVVVHMNHETLNVVSPPLVVQVDPHAFYLVVFVHRSHNGREKRRNNLITTTTHIVQCIFDGSPLSFFL